MPEPAKLSLLLDESEHKTTCDFVA